ncbi:MAG: transglutaminase domain-containing protein [Phycisphaerales bacterium]|jgi:transglutaminase-like putative cysteine protease|nr:transglutaminase domain-containing protein [Phycisphaerales bacterium]
MALMLGLAYVVAAGPPQAIAATHEPIPHLVTADIQAGIEKHIADRTREGGGWFTLPFGDEQLRLKLVRVHTEYLANLGPRRHFACVDLASSDGHVYDVDFFLEGDPGDMRVTETTIHKLNGRPYYVWKQQPDKTWVRAEVDDATPDLMGIVEGEDRFEFIYSATVPPIDAPARMWIPIPESDRFQDVRVARFDVPGRQQMLTDEAYGNQVLMLELGPEHSGAQLELRFDVRRLEKGVYEDRDVDPEAFLAAERLVPDTEQFRAIAAEVLVGKEQNDLVRARAIYDHTIDHMRYMKFGEEYGQGNAQYACDSAFGNCTDFHAYFIAVARAAGIPARFAIGAAVPSNRNEGGMSGYHCWAEFHADGRWWPVDISEADKFTPLSTYYFGHHPANRIELSRGRDLKLEPGPASGPINFLAYPVLEVAGTPVPVKPRFGFRRVGR